MCTPNIQTKSGFLCSMGRWLFPLKTTVPAELLQAINDCTSTADLIELLFATDFILDEALITAFDRRFAELEQGHTLTVYQTLKPKLKNYNHGTRTV